MQFVSQHGAPSEAIRASANLSGSISVPSGCSQARSLRCESHMRSPTRNGCSGAPGWRCRSAITRRVQFQSATLVVELPVEPRQSVVPDNKRCCCRAGVPSVAAQQHRYPREKNSVASTRSLFLPIAKGSEFPVVNFPRCCGSTDWLSSALFRIVAVGFVVLLFVSHQIVAT